MNPIWFSGPGWAALLNALLNTLWQGALASAALFAALRMIPAQRASLRYGLSAAALAGVLLAGVGGWAWRAAPPDHARNPVAMEQPGAAGNPTPTSHEIPAANHGTLTPATGQPWARWAGYGWLAGVMVCLLRAGRGVTGAGRLRRGCRDLTDPRLLALAAELCAQLRISRPVRFLVSAEISMPSVMGVFGAAVLIPASMLTGIPPEQWRAILAHELAHVRRCDYLVNLGQMLVEALLFFNPFVWWISRQMRFEREACCDQLAAGQCQSPARYVAALVSVIEHRQTLPAPVLAAGGESGSDALDRARRLLAPGYTPALRMRWFSFAGVCALGILALSGLGLGARAVAEALTPQERIAQIARLQANYAPAAYPDEKFQIKGIVHQEDGAPLTGRPTLYVYSMRQGSSEISAVDIDPAGTFSISTPCGQIRMAVYADGWAPVFLGPFDTNKGQPANLVIPMQRGFAGEIHTVDEAGQPVPGVRLSWTYLSMPGGPANQETTSDAAGLATLPHASPLPLDMKAWAGGYQADEVQALRLDPAKPYTWTLRKAQPLHGQITSAAAGAPIAGATIKLAAIFGRAQIVYGYPGDAPLLATSDARGEFTLDTLPKGGNCWLYVEAAGYGNVVVKSVQPSTETLRIALGPELTVSGTVANLKPGETTLWYSQSFQIGDCNYSQRQSTVALKPDESGKASFNLRQLYAAPLTITAGPLADPQIVKIEPEDLPKSGLRIDLAAGEAKAAPLAPTREVVVHFKTPEGSPPASGSIQVVSGGPITLPLDHGRKSIPSGQPEVPVENGVAKFEAQTPTTLILGQSRLIGYSLNMPAAIEVPDGDGPRMIEVAVQPAGAIYGEAVEADGSPGAGLLIFARTFKHPHDPGYIVEADIKNQSWGPNDLQNQFVATGLPFGGEYVIQVQRDDLNVSSEPVRIDASDPIQHVKLVVPAGHPLTVHLSDENGAPAAGIAFRLRYLASPDNRSDGPIHWSDSEGLCTIPSVNLAALDRYSVRVESRSQYQPAMTPCAAGQSSVDVHLKTGKTLTGTVVDAASFRPVAGVEVYAWSAGDPSKPGPPAFAIFEAEAPTDERGRFKFSDLPDYNVYLNTRQANLADPRTRPEAKPGQSDPVELQVKLLPGSEARIVTPGIPEVVP